MPLESQNDKNIERRKNKKDLPPKNYRSAMNSPKSFNGPLDYTMSQRSDGSNQVDPYNIDDLMERYESKIKLLRKIQKNNDLID